LYYNFTEGV